MVEPQVPRMPDLMAAAVDALAAGLDNDRAREARIHHANHGRFGDVLRGFNGQGQVTRARMSREIIATRNFDSNTGQALRELASSEYFATLEDSPQYAIGEANLYREVDTSSISPVGNFSTGVIPAGTPIGRPAVKGEFKMPEAKYVTTADVMCGADDAGGVPPQDLGGGQWRHTQFVSLPLIASRSGADSNTITGVTAIIGQLFDSSVPEARRFKAGSITTAGGSSGITDAQVRALAKAMARGRHGATNGAAIAGCLSDPRVRRVAVSLDYTTAVLRLYVADASWATSARLRDQVKQKLFDHKWLGFGARVAMGRIYNQPIALTATVVLRSAAYQAERSAITTAIRAALTEYFDERPDFYTWNLSAIGAKIAAADSRVLTCANPVVLSEGSPAVAPATTIAGFLQGIYTDIPHFLLTGLTLNFVVPGS